MIALNNGQYIIGFDNGYQFGKTAQTLFDNGVHAMGKVETFVKEHSLKYERKYYKVGEGRAVMDGELNRCLEQIQNIVQEELVALKEMAAEAMVQKCSKTDRNMGAKRGWIEK
ncbi:MAG: hypothetical protein HFI29_10640 [Lachnospiraceae bacterium]|jgi:hypothetical protein|nr:hypothetical protein [Lachnospiraceae bacterium]